LLNHRPAQDLGVAESVAYYGVMTGPIGGTDRTPRTPAAAEGAHPPPSAAAAAATAAAAAGPRQTAEARGPPAGGAAAAAGWRWEWCVSPA
jgi:hypothetical protein